MGRTRGILVMVCLVACGGDDGNSNGGGSSSGAATGATTSTGATGDGGGGDGTTGAMPGSSSGGAAGSESGGTTGGGGDSSSGGGGSTGGSGGSSSGGQAACPDNPPEASSLVKRFDVVTLNNCGMGTCAPDADQCLCESHLEELCGGAPHYIAMGTDAHRDVVWNSGNELAAYVNGMNDSWSDGAQARADAIMATVEQNFPCGVPTYVLLNEISTSQWPNNADYRQFVVDLAQILDNQYGVIPIVASPFPTPGAHAGAWTALAAHALVAAEVYLSGQEVNASGNQVVWCRNQYQASIDAYAARGVDLSRLVLVEHFGQTLHDTGWGRSGVSAAGWHNAIDARSNAAAQLGFAGYGSYAWGFNWMHATEENRLAFIDTYNSHDLP